MKILYIAKHGNGHNDDEGAIAYALGLLGHVVTCIDENRVLRTQFRPNRYDFVLIHKFNSPVKLKELRSMYPVVFWFFDLVETKTTERSIRDRDRRRMHWMKQVRASASLGFCTDGDWVEKSKNQKRFPGCDVLQLMQGFDERLILSVESEERQAEKKFDIYFGGTLRNCGRERNQWFKVMSDRYGSGFRHSVEAFREACRDEVDTNTLAIAPPFPVTDRYYSNRVYNFCGYGACLLHPFSKKLDGEYEHDKEIVFYHSRTDMVDRIDALLKSPEIVLRIKKAAEEKTQQKHLYRHRCERLIDVVADRFDLNNGETK
tara:strand:- start:15022 stop:15972 length:951 start_codon:yes stop_codon:yes gene_type:complete